MYIAWMSSQPWQRSSKTLHRKRCKTVLVLSSLKTYDIFFECLVVSASSGPRDFFWFISMTGVQVCCTRVTKISSWHTNDLDRKNCLWNSGFYYYGLMVLELLSEWQLLCTCVSSVATWKEAKHCCFIMQKSPWNRCTKCFAWWLVSGGPHKTVKWRMGTCLRQYFRKMCFSSFSCSWTLLSLYQVQPQQPAWNRHHCNQRWRLWLCGESTRVGQ